MSDDAHHPHVSLIRRRRRGVGLVVAVAVLAGGLGLFAGMWIKSPADVAANTEPPPPTILTAPVERRVVSDELVTRGTVGALSTVSGVPTQAPSGVTTAVITGIPARQGDTLSAGSVVVEISGQPVFFLPGKLPAYRDLGAGARGPDVTQLQDALRAAGLSVHDRNGIFGAGTGRAIQRLYVRSGYGGIKRNVLPISSVVYVDSDTAKVVALRAKLGTEASAAKVSLASGQLVVLVGTGEAASDVLHPKVKAKLYSEILDSSASGTVTGFVSVSETRQAVITPTTTLPARWIGQDVRVTVTSAASDGPVLAVPVSAVFLDGAGQPAVTLVAASGRQRTVRVQVGATGSGYVEIKPSDSDVAVGAQVLVGVQ